MSCGTGPWESRAGACEGPDGCAGLSAWRCVLRGRAWQAWRAVGGAGAPARGGGHPWTRALSLTDVRGAAPGSGCWAKARGRAAAPARLETSALPGGHARRQVAPALRAQGEVGMPCRPKARTVMARSRRDRALGECPGLLSPGVSLRSHVSRGLRGVLRPPSVDGKVSGSQGRPQCAPVWHSGPPPQGPPGRRSPEAGRPGVVAFQQGLSTGPRPKELPRTPRPGLPRRRCLLGHGAGEAKVTPREGLPLAVGHGVSPVLSSGPQIPLR